MGIKSEYRPSALAVVPPYVELVIPTVVDRVLSGEDSFIGVGLEKELPAAKELALGIDVGAGNLRRGEANGKDTCAVVWASESDGGCWYGLAALRRGAGFQYGRVG